MALPSFPSVNIDASFLSNAIGAAKDSVATPLQGGTAALNSVLGISEASDNAVLSAVVARLPSAVGTALARAGTSGSLVSQLQARDEHGLTALLIASKNADPKIVDNLVSYGASIADVDMEGRSALHHAVLAGSKTITKQLLLAGADATLADNQGFTVSHLASNHEKPSMLHLLHVMHALVHSPSSTGGQYPIHLAVQGKRMQCLQLLIASGCSIKVTDDHGLTPLHAAVVQGSLDLVRVLQQAGADVNAPDVSGRTPLMSSLQLPDLSVFHFLLRCDVNVAAQDSAGNTALHIAAEDGNEAAANILAQAGALLDASNLLGQTPIHVAAMQAHISVIRVLIQCGCDLSKRDSAERLWLSFIPRESFELVTGWVLERIVPIDHSSTSAGPSVRVILDECQLSFTEEAAQLTVPASTQEHFDMIKSISHMVQMVASQTPSTTRQLMLYACRTGNIKLLTFCISHGGSVDQPLTVGLTPLHVSASERQAGTLAFLIENGANVSTTDKAGWTALHHAAYSGSIECIKLLLDAGVAANSVTRSGETPLHMAMSMDDEECIWHLLRSGASLEHVDKRGSTPLDLASEHIKTALSRAVQNKSGHVATSAFDESGVSLSAEDKDAYERAMVAAAPLSCTIL